MLKKITIHNYKSVVKAEIPLGRINVFIGENGAGKSNILEAVALAGAASAGKLDNEFLVSRGIRVSSPMFMRSAFDDSSKDMPIEVSVTDGSNPTVSFSITTDNEPYPNWLYSQKIIGGSENSTSNTSSQLTMSDLFEVIQKINKDDNLPREEVVKSFQEIADALKAVAEDAEGKGKRRRRKESKSLTISADNLFTKFLMEHVNGLVDQGVLGNNNPYRSHMRDFVIYSPENTALRAIDSSGQIEPLGINGEGLFKLLTVMSSTSNGIKIKEINDRLRLLGWFDGFEVISDNAGEAGRLDIHDHFLDSSMNIFDHRSANEGFLFLVFYFALFSTDLTPSFFAIDNVDASLNPKLCQKLIGELVQLSKKYDKQVLLTTHNPALLDGMNLDDPEQKLFVVTRNSGGETRVRPVEVKPTFNEEAPVKLSEAFLRGALGGLPRGF